ncbi:MAG TPA: DUF2007 domain-containing protein [Actinomycetota bacterium]|nr:DUF2007 domain-containing protein [Actinomycetota bacterium]
MDRDLVLVFSTASVMEGYLAKGRLEADGIPVVLKGEAEGPYRVGPVHLWVPAAFEIQARWILERPADPTDLEGGAPA